MLVLVLIISFVGYAAFTLMRGSFRSRYLLECQEIEAIWTVLPGVVLVFLALPSLRLLYLLDEVNDPSLSIKAVGNLN